MQANDASRVISVIDKRIRKFIGSEAQVETTWAEVVGISADGKLASAYLYGETETPSEGFRIPGSLALSVGDKVKVAWDARGDRWVADVAITTAHKKLAINPVTGEILTGDGTAAPATLWVPGDPAGTAAAAVTAHEAEGDPHPGYATDGDLTTGLAGKSDTAHGHPVMSGDVEVEEDLTVGGLLNVPRVGRSVYRDTSQSIPNGTGTKITFSDALWTDADTSYSDDAIVIAHTGLYIVQVHGEWTSNSSGPWRIVGVGRGTAGALPSTWGGFGTTSNHSFAQSWPVKQTGTIRQNATFIVPLTAGDYVSMFVYQDTGGNLNITNLVFSLVRIAA